jgi:hypothetical protein
MKKKHPTKQPSTLTVDVVQTRAIVLVDEYGKERARLMCSGGDGGIGGLAAIQIIDDAGRPRIEIQVDQTGNPSIRLLTPRNGNGVTLAVNEGIGNGIAVGSHEGLPSIILGVPHPESKDPSQHPEITVLDPSSRHGWSTRSGAYSIPTQEELEKMTSSPPKQ